MYIINPTNTDGQDFYLSYKGANDTYYRLDRNSEANLNGFTKNFDTNDSLIGGTLTLDLRFYGSRKLEFVPAWKPTATEKAPDTLNFSRVSYTKNLDYSYTLLVFDFSESFVKNFDKNLVYYDAVNRTLLDSLQVRLFVGLANQDSLNAGAVKVSSDYISINSSVERIGILFTDNPNIQQFLADNATISNLKYLIYNYLPKNVNGIDEYVPIRLSVSINAEQINNLLEKNIGVELPINKIEELLQIFDVQSQIFSIPTSTDTADIKKSIYLNNIKMPITSSEFLNETSTSFDVSNFIHSLQFDAMFNYNKLFTFGSINYDFFKYGNYVYELKPELNNKDALPSKITFKKAWQGAESAITYSGFYENRSIYNIFTEISAFFKHIVWLFNEENNSSRQTSMIREIYLNKLRKIILNILFKKPENYENSIEFYKKETIYKDFYGKTYNYDVYSGEKMSNFEVFLLNLTARNYLFLIDFLWFATGKSNLKQYENNRFYNFLNEIFNDFKQYAYYSKNIFVSLDSFSAIDYENSIDMFNCYLSSIYLLYFVKQYLSFIDTSSFNASFSFKYNDYIEFNRKLLFYFNKNLNNIKIFNPNVKTQANELFLNNKYADYAKFLILFNEFLNSPVIEANFFGQEIPRGTSNYQFWHIIEKDFDLNSAKIGDSRFIMKNKEQSDFFNMLNNIDIISTMKYAFLDCVATFSGSVISLKSKIITNL